MLLNNCRYFFVNALKEVFNFSENSTARPRIKFTDGSLFSYFQTYNTSYMAQPKNINSNSIALLPSKFYNKADDDNWSSGYIYMALGTGDTAPTVEDYKLSGELITGLTFQAQSTLSDNNSLTYSGLVTNNTEQPITIKEVSLALGTKPSSSYSGAAALLTRDVLPAPVTLNTGDSKLFSVTIDFRSLTDSTINV